MPILRPITPDDSDFLAEMLYQAIFVSEGMAPPPRKIIRQPELAQYIENWGRTGDLGLLALDETTQARIGAAWLRLLPNGYGFVAADIPELSIAVDASFRGRGIGRQLMDALLQKAAAQFEAVSLSVNAQNQAAALYQQLGFITVKRNQTTLTMKRIFP
ncbi:MAG: GNAT family N-acetyltransferase [Ardenticatenaceae bacterium]|nr:GNAT family N-acetyltransferase [Ardenticatenaceae bacterium]